MFPLSLPGGDPSMLFVEHVDSDGAVVLMDVVDARDWAVGRRGWRVEHSAMKDADWNCRKYRAASESSRR
jgi:hypothetical protein